MAFHSLAAGAVKLGKVSTVMVARILPMFSGGIKHHQKIKIKKARDRSNPVPSPIMMLLLIHAVGFCKVVNDDHDFLL